MMRGSVEDAHAFGAVMASRQGFQQAKDVPIRVDMTSASTPTFRRLAGMIAWAGAVAGFAVYVVRLDSFKDAYGSVGTGVLLLAWITLFSALYYGTTSARARPMPRPAPARDSAGGDPAPLLVERVDRVVAPSAALRNTAAQARMMSILGANATGMTEQETDIMDWGFAYGVAWAVARSQDPDVAEEVVSERALHATQAVYQAYRGAASPQARSTVSGAGEPADSAAQPHAHRS